MEKTIAILALLFVLIISQVLYAEDKTPNQKLMPIGRGGDAAANRALLTGWFEAMAPYIARGEVVWVPMAEIYDRAVDAGL